MLAEKIDLTRMTGLDAMRMLLEGRAPPPSMLRTLGFALEWVEEGVVVLVGTPTETVLNPLGTVHGGWTLTLIDSCTSCAAHTTLPAGIGYTALETKANFVRAMTPLTGLVRAEGRVVAAGRKIITAEGRITDATGRLIAHGTSTLMVLPT